MLKTLFSNLVMGVLCLGLFAFGLLILFVIICFGIAGAQRIKQELKGGPGNDRNN